MCDILDAAYAGRTLRDIEESFDIELTPRLAAVATKEAILGAAQRQVEQAQRAAFVAANEAHATLCAAAARLTPEWLTRRTAHGTEPWHPGVRRLVDDPDVAATYLRAQAAVLPRDLLDSVDYSNEQILGRRLRSARCALTGAKINLDTLPCLK